MARFDADWIDSLLQPSRRGSQTAEELLTRMGVQPGMTVADVGCGPGFLTLPAARAVAPTGVVYAIDAEPAMLDLIRERAATANLTNVKTYPSNSSAIPLDDACFDLTICALVIHELPDRPAFLRELVRITRPTGRIAIVELYAEPGDTRPDRLTPEQTTRLLVDAGRPSVEVIAAGARQYLVLA